jgi:hypothetical protein
LMQQLLLISLYQPQGAWKKPFIFEIISDFCVCSSRWPLFGGSYPFTATIAKSEHHPACRQGFQFFKIFFVGLKKRNTAANQRINQVLSFDLPFPFEGFSSLAFLSV